MGLDDAVLHFAITCMDLGGIWERTWAKEEVMVQKQHGCTFTTNWEGRDEGGVREEGEGGGRKPEATAQNVRSTVHRVRPMLPHVQGPLGVQDEPRAHCSRWSRFMRATIELSRTRECAIAGESFNPD